MIEIEIPLTRHRAGGRPIASIASAPEQSHDAPARQHLGLEQQRRPAACQAPPSRRPEQVIVLGSGKGGVGKSVLSVLLAGAFQRRARNVLLLDGAQEGGHLHLLLGVRPAVHLDEVLTGQVEAREKLVSVVDRLWLLPSEASGDRLRAAADPLERARLHVKLTAAYEDHDVVVVDGGPGIESPIRSAVRADRMIVVAVPEPASLSDAYALIKVATMQAPSLPIDVLVNRAAEEREGTAVFERLDYAARRFLNRPLSYLGAVPERPSLARAARMPGGLLVAEAEAQAAVEPIVTRLLETAEK
ncbi:MAG: P-loop NTPase [Candidatus Eisenbacteria bacterium]